jgi:DNA integrity scanning protein DisA with diadenylate cyclase activity
MILKEVINVFNDYKTREFHSSEIFDKIRFKVSWKDLSVVKIVDIVEWLEILGYLESRLVVDDNLKAFYTVYRSSRSCTNIPQLKLSEIKHLIKNENEIQKLFRLLDYASADFL